MRAGYNYNKMREYSMTVGGLRNVYGGKAEVTLPTGYNMALEDMPPVGNVLPAGTPFGCDDFAKTAQPHYAFAVNATVEASATQVQVKRTSRAPVPASAWCLCTFPTTLRTSTIPERV